MAEQHNNSLLIVFLVLLLVALLFGVSLVVFSGVERPLQVKQPEAGDVYLSAADPAKPKRQFSPAEIPSWLIVHVGLIGMAQVFSLLLAASWASKEDLTKRDARMISFLCEVPMYLGLFGTLLGVCLTQFITGSLVAPLAYFTTMGGVLCYLLGKLAIWLRLPDGLIEEL